jgi:hypothetical protein
VAQLLQKNIYLTGMEFELTWCMSFKIQVIDINEEINTLKSSKSSRSKQKIAELKKREFLLLGYLLELEDQSYVNLTIRNLELLANPDLKVTVYDIQDSYLGSYAKKLKGTLQPNGHLFYECEKTNIAITNLEKLVYPKRFTGKIDMLGKSELEVCKTGFRFFLSRVPEQFKGSITSTGEVNIEITKWGTDFFGHNYMSKLICDPFGGNQEKQSEFMSNRDQIIQKMRRLRERILKSRQSPTEAENS